MLRDRDVVLLALSPLDLLCVILFSVSLSSFLFLLVNSLFLEYPNLASCLLILWLCLLSKWWGGLVPMSSDFAAGAERGWPVSISSGCSHIPSHTGPFTPLFFFLSFSFFSFCLAYCCPTSLGASEAAGREMSAVWQGERASWAFFSKVKPETCTGLGIRDIPPFLFGSKTKTRAPLCSVKHYVSASPMKSFFPWTQLILRETVFLTCFP